jgi:voltage-gated potassium channel
VGYGDVYPKTYAGRGVAVFLMLVGISLFGLLTARVAAFFVESEHNREDEIVQRLDRIERRLAEKTPPDTQP